MTCSRSTVTVCFVTLAIMAGYNAGAQLTNLFTDRDVGTPALHGSATLGSNTITLLAGGDDIWNNSDDFNYFYTPVTGDFDAIVRVLSLHGPDYWSKAHLQVRASSPNGSGVLVPAGPDANLAIQVTQEAAGYPFIPNNGPYANDIDYQWRAAANGGSAAVEAPIVPDYPDVWLRMTSVAGNISMYVSQDGASWELMGVMNPGFPSNVLVGLAACAHNDSSPMGTTAVFSDFNLFNGLSIVNVKPASGLSYAPPNTNLTFTVNSSNGVATGGISLTVNGTDQSSSLVIGGTANARTVAYAGPFQSNTEYNCLIKVVDAAGSTAYSKVYFDTISATNFTIEAEDFNFSGGQFINDPVLGSVAGSSNYINRVGAEYIDEFDPDTNAAAAPHLYRASPELVGTQVSGDLLRPQYVAAQAGNPAIEDYDVTQVVPGEWLNYTRTFAPGAYQILARWSDTYLFGNGGTFAAGLNEVLSASTASNQVTALLGTFQGTGTVGWQTWPFSYMFSTLRDAFGNPVSLPLSGQTTLSTLMMPGFTGALNINCLMFVPVSNPGILPPYVAAISPPSGATGVLPLPSVNIVIINRSTQVQSSGIRLWLNGTEETSSASITPTAVGATVAFVPTQFLPPGSNWVALTYSDNGTPPNNVSNSWSFTVTNAPILPSSWALPLSSGQGTGFTVRDSQQTESVEDSTTRTEAQLAGQVLPLDAQGFDTPQVINYWGSGGTGDFPTGAANFPGINEAYYQNGIALEAVAYLALNRGVYTFGIWSDTGFRLTAGLDPHAIVNDPTNATTVGEYNGASGGSDVLFSFGVQTSGLYPFRLTYEDGNNAQAVQFYSVNANGDKILINDLSNPNSIRAYPLDTAFPSSAVTIAKQPTNQTVAAFSPVTLSVAPAATAGGQVITNPYEFHLQWQQNGSDILGANSASYFIPYATAGDMGTYQCKVTYLGYPTLISTSAVVTVSPNTSPPAIVSSWVLAGGNIITVLFNRPMDPGTAQNTANYSVTGATVTSATVQTNDINAQAIVLLLNQPAGAGAQVQVNGVQDVAGNVVNSGVSTADVIPLTDADIGTMTNGAFSDPIVPGAVAPLGSNSFEVIAGGSDIWNNMDGFNFLYTALSGDFAINVRVASLTEAAYYSKAGLMIRESLDADSRDLNLVVQPLLGNDVINANFRDTTDGPPGGWGSLGPAPAIPNAWIRLTRQGQLFQALYGTDGVNWTNMGQIDYTSAPYPDPVFVGMCTSAADNTSGVFTEAEYDLFTITPGLSITQSGKNVILSWPTVGGLGLQGFGLQTANSLTVPISWAPVSQSVVTNASISTVTIPIGAGPAFYRLAQ